MPVETDFAMNRACVGSKLQFFSMCSFAINIQSLTNEPERFFSGLGYAVATCMYLEILCPSTPAQPVTYSTGCDVNIQELNNRLTLVPQIELNHWLTKNNYERFIYEHRHRCRDME